MLTEEQKSVATKATYIVKEIWEILSQKDSDDDKVKELLEEFCDEIIKMWEAAADYLWAMAVSDSVQCELTMLLMNKFLHYLFQHDLVRDRKGNVPEWFKEQNPDLFNEEKSNEE